ncbi:MAG: DinB family protein [Dermatophilaceae bacterium]
MGATADGDPDPTKEVLLRYLQRGRESLLTKLDGVDEYDARRPVVPTGTNLLGIVKHVASVESGYLGDVFGRPSGEHLPWLDDDAEANADMWATEDESREDVVALYRRVWAHSDATIAELELDAAGRVPWWGEHGDVTLRQVLIHMIDETSRHAGHADVVRELIDGVAGLRKPGDNLPEQDANWWIAYRERLQRTAERFR